MFDRWEYTVPANTSEADAIKVDCLISPGILMELRVFAPPGCAGLLHCRVQLGEKAIAPRSPKHELAGEGFIAEMMGMNEPISEDLPVLRWTLWNLDDTYDHTPWMSALWLSVKESYEKQTTGLLADFVSMFKKFMGLE